MRLVHWNTHHGGVPVDAAGANKPIHVDGITQHLIQMVPDLVCLNEIEENDGYGNVDQLETHRAALQLSQSRQWYSAFCAMTGGGKLAGGGVGILSSRPILGNARKALYPGNRPALAVMLDSMVVIATHWDPDSQTKRVIEGTQLLVWAEELSYATTIIAGDFNAAPTTLEVASWPTLYKDAWNEALKLKTATGFSGNTHNAHRIDYVWYKGLLTVVSVDVPETGVSLSLGGAGDPMIFPSDHRPVVVTFK